MQIQAGKRLRRSLDPLSWVLLGLALVVIAYNAFIFLWAWQLPGDGCVIYTMSDGLYVNATPDTCVLQYGDIITAINGRDLNEGFRTPGFWYHEFFGDSAAQSASYTVLRDGQTLQTEIAWQRLSFGKTARQLGLLSLIGQTFVLSAVFILLSRTREPGAPLVAAGFIILGLNLINNIWSSAGVNLFLTLSWLHDPLDILSFTMEMPIILHALLIFPERKWVLKRFPKAIWGVYALNASIMGLSLSGFGGPTILTARAYMYVRYYYPLAVIEYGIALGHLIHTYLTSQRPGVRNQIRWFMWGIVLGITPWILLYNVPVILTGRPLVAFDLTMLSGILVPISFFFSVTRRGLMTIDTLIRRSLIYAGVSALLLGIYLLVVTLLERTLLALGIGGRLPGIVALLLVAMIATPLREKVRDIVDRLFYRTALDFQSVMREAARQLSTSLQMETIAPLLTQDVPARLNITGANLLLQSHGGGLRAIDGSGLTYPDHHPLTEQLTEEDPLIASQTGRTNASLKTLAEEHQWEVLLPLRSGGRLVGVYILGPKLRGDLYVSTEVETLVLLAHQIAATIENAQLYEQIEAYSRGLEDLVAERTTDLARERDRLNVIVDTMADGLLVTDAHGRILLVNPIFQTMVRRSVENLLDQSIDTLFDCADLTASVSQALKHPGEVFSARCPLYNMIIQAASTALRDGSGVITVLRDITHEVEVDRMKTDFISTVSHELRTPLTSVLGFTKLISKSFERDIFPQLPEDNRRAQTSAKRIHDNLEIIILEGERLTRLINDVLDIAKMESGKIEWHDQTFQIDALIHQALEGVRGMAQGKSLALRSEISGELPTLWGDPDRYYQVLVNLLSNAIKFTPAGEIAVRVRQLSPGQYPRDWQPPQGSPGGLLISVVDTGPGIPAAALPNLFQRFHQVKDEASSERHKGTGLGLAISREIVTHYDGIIWVESVLGEGSAFSFTIPLPSHAEQPAQPHDIIVAPPVISEIRRHVRATLPNVCDTALTVLVVDDEPSIRSLLIQELKNGGYQTLEASNGSLALAIARQQRPDLIVLDVMMPDISGFDVTRVLKSDPQTRDIPILILSILEDRQRGLALGADAYLTKPVKPQTLLSTVATLLHQTPECPKALVAGRERKNLTGVTAMLKEQSFEVREAGSPDEVLHLAQETQPNLIVLDEALAQADEAALLKALRFQDTGAGPTIIVISGGKMLDTAATE